MDVTWIVLAVVAGWPLASVLIGLVLGRAMGACANSSAGLSPSVVEFSTEVRPFVTRPHPAPRERGLAG